jgi:hypothetical protein
VALNNEAYNNKYVLFAEKKASVNIMIDEISLCNIGLGTMCAFD